MHFMAGHFRLCGALRSGVVVGAAVFILGMAMAAEVRAQNLPPGIYSDVKEDGSNRRSSAPPNSGAPSGASEIIIENCTQSKSAEAQPLPPRSPPNAHFVINCYCSGKDPAFSFKSMGENFRRYGFGQAFPNRATRSNIRDMAQTVANGGTNAPNAAKLLRQLGLYNPFRFSINPRIGQRKSQTYYCVGASELQGWFNALEADARKILRR